MITTRIDRQKGQAIVLIALMIAVLFGFLGLAVDGGRAYLDRREMQSAVDSAALAMADSFIYQSNMATAMQAGTNVFMANARIYGAASASWCATPAPPASGAPDSSCSTTVTFGGDAHSLTLGYTDRRGSNKGIVFQAAGTDSLALAFMTVLGVGPRVSLGATASTVTYDQGETPAILTLGNQPCNGQSGTSLTVQGGNGLSVNVIGDVYSDGGFAPGGSANVDVTGNVYENCGSIPISGVSLSNSAYNEYTNQGVISNNYLGGNGLPVSSNYQGAASWPSTAVEVSPGQFSSDPKLTTSQCFFLDPGMYFFNAGFSDNGGLVSNELRPPDEPAYAGGALNMTARAGAGGTDDLQFWANGVTCDGAFTAVGVESTNSGNAALAAPAGGGNYGVEITTGRRDAFNGVYYNRESAPSMCRSIHVSGNNGNSANAIQVGISNVPGAQWYNVYLSTAAAGGCSAAQSSFGYAGSVCSGQTTVYTCAAALTMSNSKSSCPNLPSWPSSPAPYTPSGPSQNAGTCTLGYTISNIIDNSSLSGWGPTGAVCSSVPVPGSSLSGCRPPDVELCPAGFNTSGQAICVTGEPNAVPARNAPTNGDVANENQCSDYSGNQVQCPGLVTPGGVQFVFNNNTNSCVGEQGGGGVWVFAGKQYDWIAVYSTNATCGGNCPNQIKGNAATQYVGTLYFPTTTLCLGGSGQSQVASQVIALNCTIDGSSGVTVAFNPNYVPVPPAGRLVV